jgi:hypothetical protein
MSSHTLTQPSVAQRATNLNTDDLDTEILDRVATIMAENRIETGILDESNLPQDTGLMLLVFSKENDLLAERGADIHEQLRHVVKQVEIYHKRKCFNPQNN